MKLSKSTIESTYLTLVRHGETTGNVEKLFHGATNSPLTKQGEQQAQQVALRLKQTHPHVTTLYSSPLKRALQTASPIAHRLNLSIQIKDDLREVNLGTWEGLSMKELNETHHFWKNARKNPDFAPHGGESSGELAKRASSVLQTIAMAHQGESVIIVGHGGVFCSALAALLGSRSWLGEEFFMENCAVTELVFEPQPRLLLLNFTLAN